MKSLYSIAGGIVGTIIPIATTATQIDYSNPREAGVYLGLSFATAIFTGIAGFHIGNKLERKLNNNITSQDP